MRDVMECIKLKHCMLVTFMIDAEHHILIFAGIYKFQVIVYSYFNTSEAQLYPGWGLVWLYGFSIIPFFLIHTITLLVWVLITSYLEVRSTSYLIPRNLKCFFFQNVPFLPERQYDMYLRSWTFASGISGFASSLFSYIVWDLGQIYSSIIVSDSS